MTGDVQTSSPATPSGRHRRLRAVVAAWQRGEVTSEVVCRTAYRALHDECAGCRTAAPDAPAPQPARVAEELRSLEQLVDSTGGWEAALGAIAAEPARYGSPELAAALSTKAQEELPTEPRRSGRWAELAAAVAGLGTSPESRERLAQALVYQGNAVRVAQSQGLSAAEPWFTGARALLARSGVCSIAVAADIDRLEASLMKDALRYEIAIRLYLRAISLYLAFGDETLAARTTLSLALAYRVADRMTEAIQMSRAAHAWSVEAGDEKIQFLSLFNLSCNLESSGRLADARLTLELARRIDGRPTGEKVRRHLRWMEILLDAQEGSDRELAALWTLYDEHLAAKSFYDALEMLFDIARVARGRGRSSELPRVADELVLLVRSTPIRRGESRELLRRILEQSEIAPWLDPREMSTGAIAWNQTPPESP